jgi:hypothetical protein
LLPPVRRVAYGDDLEAPGGDSERVHPVSFDVRLLADVHNDVAA